MNRNYQPRLLDHLLESGFLLWVFWIIHTVVFCFILSSELGEMLRNQFFPLLLLATIVWFANTFLAAFKCSNWFSYCDKSQEKVLMVIESYKFLFFMLKVSVFFLLIINFGVWFVVPAIWMIWVASTCFSSR
ncbi:hypothetical protein [Crocosphaera chwakensis]|nr:hypothetical protein [Crocosphaera chwakensis]